MQELREIALLLAKSKTLDSSLTEDVRQAAFFDGLLKNQFANEEEAAQHFLEVGKDHPNYQKFRSKFKKSLINSVFLLDLKQQSTTQRQLSYFECYKEWAAAKILMTKSAKTAAVNLCRKILKEAKKYEFTDLCLQIASYLRQHYGTVKVDAQKFKQYNQLYKEYEFIWRLENDAEELYIDLMINYVNTKATKTALHDKAAEYYDKLKEDMQACDAYRLHLCGNLIRLLIYTSKSDYVNAVTVCDEAIQFFENKGDDAHMPLQVFLYQKVVGYTQLKQYEAGKDAVEKCIAVIEEGSFNWFKLQEAYILLALHTKEYQSAYYIFSTAVNQNQFPFLPPTIAETWKILEAYIHYLILIEQIMPKTSDKRFSGFRLNRFLNETPIYSKDKRGMNIPILIIQILLLIYKKKFHSIADKMEAIEKYCTRYLRQDSAFRSNCIIKMLLQIPAARFHQVAVGRKVQQYLEKLRTMPLNVANQAHEIEIIPYEELWGFAIASLGNNFHQLRTEPTSLTG